VYGAKWAPVAGPVRLLTTGLALAGLRLAIGSIYYAKGYPALDIALHGLRLLLIVAAVTLAAPLGLAGVCAAMSAVESLVSVAGQWLVCRLIGITLLALGAATMPGLRSAAGCAFAAIAGAALGNLLGVGGVLPLALTLTPAAAVFAWQERATVGALLYGSAAMAATAGAVSG
jgi:hypothetical protein